MMKPKFDGYAAQYDAWFMENDNLFQSELRLFQTALGDIAGKRVLLIEDHISTGLSLLSAVEGLKAEGATVTDCLAITSFGIDETNKLFEKQQVRCHEMIDFTKVIDKAIELGTISADKKEVLNDWLANPWTWAARHALTPMDNEN